MYGTIRRYKVSNPKAFSEKVNAEFINLVRKVPGFVSYHAIDEGNGNWASVTLFTTAEGITRSDELAADWVAKACPDLVSGPPEITKGPVAVK
jgi:hypothetical protein